MDLGLQYENCYDSSSETFGATRAQQYSLSIVAGLLLMAGTTAGISQLRTAMPSAVERSRVLCHAVAGARKPTAPAFFAIVRRPGRDDEYLRGFLEDDHFPMTMYPLFSQEKEDVLAYFRSLRTKR